MIEAWTWPAVVGVLAGAALFAALFIPILVWESRRFGQIRAMRVVGAAMVAIYAVALVAYTLLPLPDAQWCAANASPVRNLHPGAFIPDIESYYHQFGIRRLLKSFVFLQVAFNVVLFVPFGALWRRYFGGGIFTATLFGGLTSVAIESAQATGVFGLMPCVYRMGDVDDVILNTSGSLIGALLAGALLFLIPDARSASRRRSHPRPVTRRRRVVGMFLDWALLIGAQAAFALTWRLTEIYLLGKSQAVLSDDSDTFWVSLVAFGFVVLIPAMAGSGASLGQRVMWLEPRFERPSLGAKLKRSMCGFGGWALLTTLETYPGLPEPVTFALSLGGLALFVATAVTILADSSARGLSLKASGGQMVDSRS